MRWSSGRLQRRRISVRSLGIQTAVSMGLRITDVEKPAIKLLATTRFDIHVLGTTTRTRCAGIRAYSPCLRCQMRRDRS
jgi:hypothetical protein